VIKLKRVLSNRISSQVLAASLQGVTFRPLVRNERSEDEGCHAVMSRRSTEGCKQLAAEAGRYERCRA